MEIESNDTILELEGLVAAKSVEFANFKGALDIVEEELAVLEYKLEAARDAVIESLQGPWEWSCHQCVHDTQHPHAADHACFKCGWHGVKLDYSMPPDKYQHWLSVIP